MCYSASVESSHRHLQRDLFARPVFPAYQRLFHDRAAGQKVKVPRAMEADFLLASTPEEANIATLIEQYRAAEEMRLEQEVFTQRKRLADAERKLAVKLTKTAEKERGVATRQAEKFRTQLADVHRTESKPLDTRIFPDSYAHIMFVENGERVLRPMRYGLRPAGMPASIDEDLTLFNSRKNKLTKFWRGQFGHTHAVAIWHSFFEHVDRQGKDVVLQFNPIPSDVMMVACLYSHWTPPPGSDEQPLWSFSVITDEPPPEVLAAGHDRCIIPIKASNLDAWLSPDPANLQEQQEILDDRVRLFYEHQRMAA